MMTGKDSTRRKQGKACPYSLNGRVALVTGAGGYLGGAISRGLALAGAHVILNDIRMAGIKTLEEKIKREGGCGQSLAFDLRDEAAIQHNIDRIEESIGRLDIVINNASASKGANLETTNRTDFHLAIHVNLLASMEIIRAARPLLRQTAPKNPGGSSIINIASMYGVVSPDPRLYPTPGVTNPPSYGAAKAALIQLTKYAACEFARDGIRVNAISPGPFPQISTRRESPEFAKHLEERVPLRRLGKPEELVGPVLFLASDASSYVTGTNLIVDGGWTAW